MFDWIVSTHHKFILYDDPSQIEPRPDHLRGDDADAVVGDAQALGL